MHTYISFEFLPVVFGLLGGLALFLYGMEQLTNALTIVAGKRMKNLLTLMTSNRIKGLITGAFVTAVLQSSSVTTVLIVGFISAGLIQLKQAISIIMGAHIGTTLTVQIIAFKVTELALLMIAAGFGLKLLVKKEKIKYLGLMIMGLGLIFLGMNLMSNSTEPLRTFEPFLILMKYVENPLFAVLISTLFTSIIQSSAATIGMVMAFASQGFVSLETGIALTFGANIGTCITAVLASIGSSRQGKQAALSHVLINFLGVIIWLPFIQHLSDIVRIVSPSFSGYSGLGKIAAEVPRQIANAHTVFNIANSIIFLPFTLLFAKIVTWLLPAKEEAVSESIIPKYLDKIYLKTPQIALDRVRMEIARQARRVLWMVREIPQALNSDDKEKLKLIKKMDNEVDALHEIILNFLGQLSKQELTNQESKLLQAYLSTSNYIENVGDVVETNLYSLGKERLKSQIDFKDSLDKYLSPYFNKVIFYLDVSLKSLIESNPSKAFSVIDAKYEITELADAALNHLSLRLHKEKNLDLDEFRIQTDVIENFRRIYYLSKRIAKVITSAGLNNNQRSTFPLQEELPFK